MPKKYASFAIDSLDDGKGEYIKLGGRKYYLRHHPKYGLTKRQYVKFLIARFLRRRKRKGGKKKAGKAGKHGIEMTRGGDGDTFTNQREEAKKLDEAKLKLAVERIPQLQAPEDKKLIQYTRRHFGPLDEHKLLDEDGNIDNAAYLRYVRAKIKEIRALPKTEENKDKLDRLREISQRVDAYRSDRSGNLRPNPYPEDPRDFDILFRATPSRHHERGRARENLDSELDDSRELTAEEIAEFRRREEEIDNPPKLEPETPFKVKDEGEGEGKRSGPPGPGGKNGTGKKSDDDQGLSNIQINKIMGFYKDFYGAIPRDGLTDGLLKKIKPLTRGSLIMNTDKSTSKNLNGHWVALYWDAREHGSNSIEYYDSGGQPILPDLRKELSLIVQRLKPKTYLVLKENLCREQSYTSPNCGPFCIRFLVSRYRNKNFKESTPYCHDVIRNEKEIEIFKKDLPAFGLIAG